MQEPWGSPVAVEGRATIAIRTLAGLGLVDTLDTGGMAVGPGTLVVVSAERLARYRCAQERWDFWWFECRPLGPTAVPVDRVTDCPLLPGEEDVLARCFDSLRHQQAGIRACASAVFTDLLYRWLEVSEASAPAPGADRVLHQCVAAMQERLDGSLRIPELAAMAGLGERRFRQVFRQRLGLSPKAFSDRLRLDLAARLLAIGGSSIGQIADRLGFSSPFHFSRAFRKRFGRPPSAAGR